MYRITINMPRNFLNKLIESIKNNDNIDSIKCIKCMSYHTTNSMWTSDNNCYLCQGYPDRDKSCENCVFTISCDEEYVNKISELITKHHPYKNPSINICEIKF